MASRHHSLDLTETRDMVSIIQSFEEHNQIQVALLFSALNKGKFPELLVIANAYPPGQVYVEDALLASARLHTTSTNLRDLKSVAMHVLYLLDAQLALKEMQEDPENRA